MKRTISGVYDNGTITIHDTIRLNRKLRLKNRSRIRFTVLLADSPVAQTFGILQVPKRLARHVAESPEFDLFNA